MIGLGEYEETQNEYLEQKSRMQAYKLKDEAAALGINANMSWACSGERYIITFENINDFYLYQLTCLEYAVRKEKQNLGLDRKFSIVYFLKDENRIVEEHK